MRCPHCLVNFHPEEKYSNDVATDDIGTWDLKYVLCPACEQPIVTVRVRSEWEEAEKLFPAFPKSSTRPVPAEVPREYAEDFTEACLVLPDSPKASAALSRRCLQNILRGPGGTTHGDLYSEITQVMPSLPSYLRDAVDSVRVAGNFATHPLKSTNTGEIVSVEPGEAEWLLDVLELLFDFYFVQPARATAMKVQLQGKLTATGSKGTVR